MMILTGAQANQETFQKQTGDAQKGQEWPGLGPRRRNGVGTDPVGQGCEQRRQRRRR